MAINPVQTNIENTKSHRPYKDAKGAVKTDNCLKPLQPQGHLVHDTLLSVPKFFIKDIAYDMKAVKDGFAGKANDHQTGRLNDVGLKVGGIGIATYLASRTTNPMFRIMEYVGLGTFLTSMALFPKAFINVPSRIVHGFSIGKEYIDDQGRKKSVFQDSNYIPFDMYRGEYPGENLEIIGDRMGIPRGLKNRDELTKEQMRKIATQNNTLWMLTAGFATPVMTALICCGLEKLIAPALEKARNMEHNSQITHLLAKTNKMPENLAKIPDNKLSKQVSKLLNNYKNKELPQAEFDNLVDIITKDLDSYAKEGIQADLKNILINEKKAFVLNEKSAEEISSMIKAGLPMQNNKTLEKVFVPTADELKNIFKENERITPEELQNIKGKIKELFDKKIANEPKEMQDYLKSIRNNVVEKISKKIQEKPSRLVSEADIKDITNLAKVMGEFKANAKALDKNKIFKIGYAPETVLARSYGNFERTLLDVLEVKYKDLKSIKESKEYAREFLDKKFTELAKDTAKYEKAINKLGKSLVDMEIKLNGKNADSSHLKDLITAIENNYNKTAKCLGETGRFKNTIDMLVKGDLDNSIKTKQELFDLLDGINPDNTLKLHGNAYAKANAKGVGSSKKNTITNIVERYQGAKDSMFRMLHAMDIYKREIPADEYSKELLKSGKKVLLGSTNPDHTLKLDTEINAEFYKDLMDNIWDSEGDKPAIRNNLKAKGKINKATENALKETKGLKNGNVQERLQWYITRFRNIMGNNTIDFTKPSHNLDLGALRQYSPETKTRKAMFDLVAQDPIDFIQKASTRRYNNQRWARVASSILGTVLGVTLLAQVCFGKIKNPHNLKKQVNDDKTI